MIPSAYRCVGIDIGASLAKLVLRDPQGLSFRCFSSRDIERAVREVERFAPDHVAVTGAGARQFAQLLEFDATTLVEFHAWVAGAAALLAHQGLPASGRDLVVSLGTGTSMLLVGPEGGARLGGTTLGGGTLQGLAKALLSCEGHAELMALAAQGDRSKVDLRVSDLDPEGALPLPGHVTASSLAKLAAEGATPAPHDIAHALVGMVAETVGIVARTLAAASDAKRILYGGTTLRGNAPMRSILTEYGMGCEVIFLENGEYAGALGAIELLSA